MVSAANRRAALAVIGLSTSSGWAPRPGLRAVSTLPRPLDDADLISHTPRGNRLTKGTLAYQWRPIAAALRAGEISICISYARRV
jgi:hypothetical protein